MCGKWSNGRSGGAPSDHTVQNIFSRVMTDCRCPNHTFVRFEFPQILLVSIVFVFCCWNCLSTSRRDSRSLVPPQTQQNSYVCLGPRLLFPILNFSKFFLAVCPRLNPILVGCPVQWCIENLIGTHPVGFQSHILWSPADLPLAQDHSLSEWCTHSSWTPTDTRIFGSSPTRCPAWCCSRRLKVELATWSSTFARMSGSSMSVVRRNGSQFQGTN